MLCDFNDLQRSVARNLEFQTFFEESRCALDILFGQAVAGGLCWDLFFFTRMNCMRNMSQGSFENQSIFPVNMFYFGKSGVDQMK